jgi:hypothetical protein
LGDIAGGKRFCYAAVSQGGGPNTSGRSTCLDIPVIFSNATARSAGTCRNPRS